MHALTRRKPSRFKRELDLVELFVAALSPTHGSSAILTELASVDGTADLVLVRLRKSWRQHHGLSLIPPRWAYTLRSLPYRKTFTTASMSELTGLSPGAARSVLQTFQSAGFCRRLTTTTWVKVAQPRMLAHEFVALEAKLHDWKKALFQATRHRSYAKQSWVLLDAAFAAPAMQSIERFRQLNIGLASASPTGAVAVHWRPEPRPPFDPIALWHANSELASRLRASAPSRSKLPAKRTNGHRIRASRSRPEP
jgi:hypothetical protein